MRPPLPDLIDKLVREQGGEPGHEDTTPRGHLGASIIGKKCSRHLWYSFRWAAPSAFEGRMLRLFATGFKYEKRFIDLLEMCGATVNEYDVDGPRERLMYHPESDCYYVKSPGEESNDAELREVLDVTDEPVHEVLAKFRHDVSIKPPKQFRCSDVNGHFGGSCDGIATGIPYVDMLGLGFGPLTRVLCEFKTHNAKSFAKLKTSGVKITKPAHYTQMCIYMEKMKIEVGLYCAVNKDTDELHFEFVLPNQMEAAQKLRRADVIINSTVPPPRISRSPTNFDCAYCDHLAICHQGEPMMKNCRTCVYSAPVASGNWKCERWDGRIIPFDFQQKGCGHHSPIPEG